MHVFNKAKLSNNWIIINEVLWIKFFFYLHCFISYRSCFLIEVINRSTNTLVFESSKNQWFRNVSNEAQRLPSHADLLQHQNRLLHNEQREKKIVYVHLYF